MQKEIITTEACREEILRRMKGNRMFILVLGGMLVSFILFMFPLFGWDNNLSWIVFGPLLIIFAVSLAKNLFDSYKVKSGGLVIIEDRLFSKDEELRYGSRLGFRYRLDRVMYFSDKRRYVLHSSERSAYEYSEAGDDFYLVYSEKIKKSVPLLAYNKKIYEMK